MHFHGAKKFMNFNSVVDASRTVIYPSKSTVIKSLLIQVFVVVHVCVHYLSQKITLQYINCH